MLQNNFVCVRQREHADGPFFPELSDSVGMSVILMVLYWAVTQVIVGAVKIKMNQTGVC